MITLFISNIQHSILRTSLRTRAPAIQTRKDDYKRNR